MTFSEQVFRTTRAVNESFHKARQHDLSPASPGSLEHAARIWHAHLDWEDTVDPEKAPSFDKDGNIIKLVP